MNLDQSLQRWNRLAQVSRALRRDGPIAVLQKLYRFARSRTAVYKSQKGQDRWVVESLNNKRGGYFVDLAASDGVTFSNTWVLEKKFGWNGVAIEANPHTFKKLASSRNCRNLECVVDSQPGVASFRIDNGGLSGIVADDTDNSPQLRGEELEEAVITQLQAKTLTQILDEAEAPHSIDYLSLDVEGAEERAIRGLDLSRYCFHCMTIEQPNEKTHEILAASDYHFVKNQMGDAFYIHRSHPNFESIECRPFELADRKVR